MSRKRDNEGGEVTSQEFSEGTEEKSGGGSGVTLELVENQPDEEEGNRNLDHNQEGENDEEKRQLLAEKEDDALSKVQVISANCQSSSALDVTNKGAVYLPRKQYYYAYSSKDEGNVKTASVTLALALFNLLWSAGLTYWHFQLDHFYIAVATLVMIVLSGAATTMSFFTAGFSLSARGNLWKCSKLAWLLAAIPCLVPIILGAFYFVSSILDKAAQLNQNSTSRIEIGQSAKSDVAGSTITTTATATTPSSPPCSEEWRVGSGALFLIESLTLCFPICVLHLCVLLEDTNSIPTLIGLYTIFGIGILSFSITFSRFNYDCLSKRDRFGEATEKYLRFCYLWSAKIIWLVTFSILIVSARIQFPGWEIEAAIGAIGVLTAIHEIPLWICLLPHCGKLAAKVSSLFFLIPQFSSLVSLIYWVNTDPHVYQTNIASIVLGVYFWSETVTLCGWLVDGSSEKDIDLVPLYPHFLGDVISSFFPEESLSNPAVP